MSVLTPQQLEWERSILVTMLEWPDPSFGDFAFRNEMRMLRHRFEIETKNCLGELENELQNSHEWLSNKEVRFTGPLIKRYQKKIDDALIECHVRLRSQDTQPDSLRFNPEIGAGFLRGRRFRFKGESLARRLFALAYAQRGKTITKAQVAEVLGIKQPSNMTNRINEAAKSVRRTTRLTTDDFVLGTGTITLTL